jgi:diguanylate cyclase (GGDEF)-like protein
MSQRILLVDDSPDVHVLVAARLRGEPVTLHHANDGEEGLALALSLQPDLILLDVEMPGTDGFETCRRLKGDACTMAIPVIFLTGACSTEEKIKGLDLGAADYVTKPFDPAELRARVRVSLRTKYLLDLLSRKAMIDGLTGLWNRAYFDQRLPAEQALMNRSTRPLACLMVDIDHFKRLNDRHGHPFGDEVLREVARAVGDGCRAHDVVCRYGGEEFAVLLPDTSQEQALTLAQRLCETVRGLRFERAKADVPVTCSIGVGHDVPSADQALYAAKHAGRDRVMIEAASLAA